MRRELLVAFALVASLLVATAPVAAGHGPVVVSSHDSATELNQATLTNMTVNGSGDAAVVELTGGTTNTVDSFEDQDITEYGGDTGSFSVTSSESPTDGSYALQGSGGTTIQSTSGLNGYPDQGDTFRVDVRTDDASANWQGILFATQDEDSSASGYFVQLNHAGDTLLLKRMDAGSETTLDSVAFSASSNKWYTIKVTWGTDDSITADLLDGGFSQATVSATDSNYVDGGIGFRAGGSDYFDHYRVDGASFDAPINLPAEYLNHHSAERTVGGYANLTTVDNVSVNVTYRGDSNGDGSYDTLLNQTTGITTAANYSFTWSEFAGDDVQVNVSVTSTGGTEAFTLEEEGVEANSAEPTVDNASASPTGTVDTATPTFNVSVSDADFPLAQGDQLTAELFIDGVSNGTDTLTSNGTASVTSSSLTGGEHDYHWVVTDSYGHSVTSQTFTVGVPSTLYVRNESDPDQLVNSATVEITFFGDEGTIVTRSTSDGTISLAGLPVDEKFVAVADADNFYQRRVIIDSLLEQQSIYLLNTSRTAVAIDFAIDDATGEFTGDNVEILVQRALNQSGNTTWKTIVGDEVGANGEVPTLLEQDIRYRILVRNAQETRTLGSYVASGPEDPEVLPIGRVGIGGDTEAGAAYGATLRELDAGRDVQLFYYDSQDVTTSLDILVYNASNTSQELLNTTITDPSQRHVETVPVPASSLEDTTWVVELNATRTGEADVDARIEVGSVGALFGDLPMDQRVLSLIGWVVWFAATSWFALRSPTAAPAASTLLATAGTLMGVFFVHPAVLGIAGAISVFVLVGGDNP